MKTHTTFLTSHLHSLICLPLQSQFQDLQLPAPKFGKSPLSHSWLFTPTFMPQCNCSHLLRRPCNSCELRNLSELIYVKNSHFFWTALFNPDQVSDPISRGAAVVTSSCKRASLQGQPVELQPS